MKKRGHDLATGDKVILFGVPREVSYIRTSAASPEFLALRFVGYEHYLYLAASGEFEVKRAFPVGSVAKGHVGETYLRGEEGWISTAGTTSSLTDEDVDTGKYGLSILYIPGKEVAE